MKQEFSLLFPSPEDAVREATKYGTPEYGAHIHVRLVQIEEGDKVRNVLGSRFEQHGLGDLTLRLYFTRRISDGKLDCYVEAGYSDPFHLSFSDVEAMHKRVKVIERKLAKMTDDFGEPQGPADVMFRYCRALGIKRVVQTVGNASGRYDDSKHRFGKIAEVARFYGAIAEKMETVIPQRKEAA